MGALTQVRPYFKTQFDALGGYEEHKDGFSVANIPNNILNKSYHVLLTSVDGGPVNHTHQATNSSVTVSVFFKGYRYVTEGIDIAVQSLNDIITRFCKIENRTNTGAGVLNVIFETADLKPFSDQNDNIIILEIKFTVLVYMGIEESSL